MGGVLTFSGVLYNNSYQATIKMAPFEALYDRRCRSSLCWNELDETLIVGLKMIQEMIERIRVVQQNMKVTHDRQKSYVDQGNPSSLRLGIKYF